MDEPRDAVGASPFSPRRAARAGPAPKRREKASGDGEPGDGGHLWSKSRLTSRKDRFAQNCISWRLSSTI